MDRKEGVVVFCWVVVRAGGSHYVDLLAVAEKLLLLMLFNVVLLFEKEGVAAAVSRNQIDQLFEDGGCGCHLFNPFNLWTEKRGWLFFVGWSYEPEARITSTCLRWWKIVVVHVVRR